MTEGMKKPEWFELINSDAPSAQVVKVDKKLPGLALLVTGALFGAGALFAHTSVPSATAGQSVATQVTSPAASSTSTTKTVPVAPVAHASNEDD